MISLDELKSEYEEFSKHKMVRPNYFDFCASIYYTRGLNAILAIQLLTTALSLIIIAIAHSPAMALTVALMYGIGIVLRKDCQSCAQIQGFMIVAVAITFSTANHLGQGVIASLVFAGWFFIWYTVSKKIYGRDNKKPV